jgi:hypothetical protein
MAGLTGSDLRRGDILLCKSYSLAPTATHFIIRAGQFAGQVLGGNAPLGQSNTVHAQIALSTGQAPVRIAESDGSGLHTGTCAVEADVFRLGRSTSPRVSDTAAAIAEELIANTASTATGRYNRMRSAFSIVRSLYYGSRAMELDRAVDEGTYTDGYFCSMFVTVCNQVAALRCGIPVPTILSGDAMNMSPSDLESYLRSYTNSWTFLGTLNLPSGDLFDRWSQRLFAHERSH